MFGTIFRNGLAIIGHTIIISLGAFQELIYVTLFFSIFFSFKFRCLCFHIIKHWLQLFNFMNIAKVLQIRINLIFVSSSFNSTIPWCKLIRNSLAHLVATLKVVISLHRAKVGGVVYELFLDKRVWNFLLQIDRILFLRISWWAFFYYWNIVVLHLAVEVLHIGFLVIQSCQTIIA